MDVCACKPDRDGPDEVKEILRLLKCVNQKGQGMHKRSAHVPHPNPPFQKENTVTEGEKIKEGRTSYKKGFVPNPKEKEVDAKKAIIKYELYSTIGCVISKEWSVNESIQNIPFFLRFTFFELCVL